MPSQGALCSRRFEIDAGHRVKGHENLCKNFHGHRYVIEVTVKTLVLDAIGRVIDYGAMKQLFGRILEDRYDHAFVVWKEDTEALAALRMVKDQKIAVIESNPTAENLARIWLAEFHDKLVANYFGAEVVKVVVWETPNCFAEAVAS